MALPHDVPQDQSPGPTGEEICTAIRSLRHTNPKMGKKRILTQLNVDNGWTITSKDFRQHINSIETEDHHTDEDATTAITTEEEQLILLACEEKLAAVHALSSRVKQVERCVENLEKAILATKQAQKLAVFSGGLLQDQDNKTDHLNEQLQALRAAAMPPMVKESLTRSNADEGWNTNSWAFKALCKDIAASNVSLHSFHGPLIITLPPSTAAAQRLAKQHNLPVRGWSTHLGTTDAIWCDPRANVQEVYSIAVPSCSDVPRFPTVTHENIRGQQLTYLLVLLATYSIEWPDLTRLFNSIWCQPDMRMVFGVEKRVAGARPYDEMREEDLKKMWEGQIMYDKDMDAMRLAMENIECEKHSEMTFVDENGQEHVWSGSPTLTIESRAMDAGVVLVKRGLQPQMWASICAVIMSSQSLRDAIERL